MMLAATVPTTMADAIPVRKPRICFVVYNGYGQLVGADKGHAGGVERQQTMMARWLAAHGFDVTVITWSAGQPEGALIRGVRHRQVCAKQAGLPLLRFFHPRWTSLMAALKRADADVYYYNIGDLGLGQITRWCRRHGRTSIFSVASDADCQPDLPLLKTWRDRALYKHGMALVDHVISQTQRQQQMMKDLFGRDSTVLPMPCDFPVRDPDERLNPPAQQDTRAAWVGRVDPNKRPEWLFDIAEKTPGVQYAVAGASNSNSDYARRLFERAAHTPNIRMLGRVAPPEMHRVYENAHVLVCTSVREGFPNTFLEAWSRGIPLITTFDPDGIVARQKLGWAVNTVDEAAQVLNSLANSPVEWQERSRAARLYYRDSHELDRCMARFAEFFCRVAK